MRALLLVSVVLAGAAGLFADGQDLTAGIDQMASDGKGRIFAFGKQWANRLAVFEAGQWKELPLSPADKPSQPRGLIRLRDGRMCSVWNAGNNQWVLAILDNSRSVRTIPFSWSLGSWDFFVMAEDSRGRIWVSGIGPEVVRCDPATGLVHVFDLAPLDTGPSKKKWNIVFFTEDLLGGLWLWTKNQTDNFVSLPRPVRVHGDSLDLLPDIPGYTGNQLVDFRVRDKNSLWIGTRDDGLFVLSLDRVSARPFPGPEKGAFSPLIGIVPFGKHGWLVLSGNESRMSFWQLADGKWTRRVPPDQCHFMRAFQQEPAYLDLKSGAILAAQNGILYFPHEQKEAKLLDWQNGWMMLNAATQFLSLGGDSFAGLSSRGSPPRWALADLHDCLAPRKQSDAVKFLDRWGWRVDGQDRIFTIILNAKPIELGIWENGSWRKEPLPAELKPEQSSGFSLELDSRDRLWVFSSNIDLPVGIFSPDLKTWEIEPDYQSALAKHYADLNGFGKDLLVWYRPITGPNGQIAFRNIDWSIRHWDGQAWKEWHLEDIGQFSKNDPMSIPFFDDTGHLCVNTRSSDKSWKLGSNGQWTGEAKMPGSPNSYTCDRPKQEVQKLPEDFWPRDIWKPWIATDNLGVTWVAGNSNLYKYYKGRTVAVFDSTTLHPFLRNPPIHTVRVDRFGNTWLQLGEDISIGHILLPAKKSKLARVSLLSDRWGMVKLDSAPEGTIKWRLDSGEWRTLRAGEKTLGFLPPGDHEVEFLILTDKLDLIAPLSKKVSIAINPSEQIDHFIAVLRAGPDGMREIAVKGLDAQPSRAIPALKAAIANADFWWLHAALQECERQSLKSSRSP